MYIITYNHSDSLVLGFGPYNTLEDCHDAIMEWYAFNGVEKPLTKDETIPYIRYYYEDDPDFGELRIIDYFGALRRGDLSFFAR